MNKCTVCMTTPIIYGTTYLQTCAFIVAHLGLPVLSLRSFLMVVRVGRRGGGVAVLDNSSGLREAGNTIYSPAAQSVHYR